MAKKVVATLKKSTGKDFAKVIRMERSAKTGASQRQHRSMPDDAIVEDGDVGGAAADTQIKVSFFWVYYPVSMSH